MILPFRITFRYQKLSETPKKPSHVIFHGDKKCLTSFCVASLYGSPTISHPTSGQHQKAPDRPKGFPYQIFRYCDTLRQIFSDFFGYTLLRFTETFRPDRRAASTISEFPTCVSFGPYYFETEENDINRAGFSFHRICEGHANFVLQIC